MKTEILPLDILAQLEKAAPRVTVPSYEAHRAVVKALGMFAGGQTAQVDIAGLKYWRAALHDLLPLTGMDGLLTPHLMGNICRNFKLVMKRENDGYKVAWSERQLEILKTSFPVEQQAVNK